MDDDRAARAARAAGSARAARIERDRRIAALAGRQHGVVDREQLLALGLGASAIASRRRRGGLTPLHRGVYAVGHGNVGERGRAVAALRAAGPDAVVSHRSAAALWDLRPSPPLTELTVTGRRPRSRAGLAVHAGRLGTADVREVDGIAVTSPARTLVDLATVEPPDVVEIALAEAQVRRLVTPAAVRAALDRASRQPGVAALRVLLDDGTAPTRTDLERAMLRIVDQAGLPRPSVNTHVAGREVDFAWPAHRLVVETDGWAAHGHRRAFERDRARDVELQVAGWTVVRFTWRQLMDKPVRVAARLGALLAMREAAAA